MDIGSIFFYVWLLIGIIVAWYDWVKYQEPAYKEMKASGIDPDTKMVMIYVMVVILVWPIRLISIFRDKSE